MPLIKFCLGTFLSTLSLRRATVRRGRQGAPVPPISIHALLAESDSGRSGCGQTCHRFLSTLSLRRATDILRNLLNRRFNFYPRSPCGERRYQQAAYSFLTDISIHALLAESDILGLVGVASRTSFLSTLSLRRATPMPLIRFCLGTFLSTLSLRRATGEEKKQYVLDFLFLSTLSLRRATQRRRA